MRLRAARVVETMDPCLRLGVRLLEAENGWLAVELTSLGGGWSELLSNLAVDLSRLPFARQAALVLSDRFRPRYPVRQCEAVTRRGWPCPLAAGAAGKCAVHERNQ